MIPALPDSPRWLGVCVGNTRTRYGAFNGGELTDSASIDNTDGALAPTLGELAKEGPVVIASVNDAVADRLAASLDAASEVFRVGRDIPIPLTHSLEDGATLGQDRALCALGAFARLGQACIVIDAGTAVTVDFVDGRGVFHGGAIAPGLNLMLRALHEHTAALPLLRYEPPGPGSPLIGKDTVGAMRRGVAAAVVGMAHHLIDRYAEYYEAYPRIIATGGDAPALFGDDTLVETIVPDLQLLGLAAACRPGEPAGEEA